MLRVIRIMDRLEIGNMIRPIFNSPFYQPRLRETDRLLQELTLPDLKPTRRIKKNRRMGAPSYTYVDPRRMDSFKNLRRLHNALGEIDRFLNRDLGPHPVKPLNDVPYVHIASADEEANKNAHPEGWLGRELVQPEVDESIKLVNHLNFLKPSSSFGNQPGDRERFDSEDNFIIVKEEPASASDDYSVRTLKKK